MGFESRIQKTFDNSLNLPLYPGSKYVIFSDCHRGTGRANDNFLRNEFLYIAALRHYYQKGFTYIELGDADELWENRSMQCIKENHMQSFEMLSMFYKQNRFFAVYGNHDITKKSSKFLKKHFFSFYCAKTLCDRPLFPDITFYPGIILHDKLKDHDIYMTHGHQADLLNSTLWRLSRFLVRYVWRPLESIGVPDPTSAAKNNTRKKKSEKKLAGWALKNNHLLVTGHTHHPMTGSKTSPYCNTGSCVHPAGITAIEIEKRTITLVKWSVSTKRDMDLYASREILGNQASIDAYF